MINETKQITQLLNDKKITQEEYSLLISAINKKESRLFKIFNPYPHLNELHALAIGVVSIIAMTLLAPIANVTFTGLLDLQTTKEVMYWQSVQRCLLQNILIVSIWSLGTWIAATICKQKNLRFIDFFIGSILARVPYMLVVLLYIIFFNVTGIDPQMKDISGAMILIIALLTIPGLILNLVYLFFGFEHASGLQSKKLWISFISLVFLIETLTVILSRTILT